MILHDWELCAESYAVRLGAALMGVALELRPVDVVPGRETAGVAFRALSPFGRLPVLEDGPVVLRTAQGALWHVARTRAPGWLPAGQEARIADWLAFAARDLWPAMAARDAALLEQPTPFADAPRAARAGLRMLESHLVEQGFAGCAWVEGEAPTIADVALFPAVALAVDFGVVLEDYPALRAWSRRVRTLPGFIAMPGVPEFL
jgi:glutathione S-transferase